MNITRAIEEVLEVQYLVQGVQLKSGQLTKL